MEIRPNFGGGGSPGFFRGGVSFFFSGGSLIFANRVDFTLLDPTPPLHTFALITSALWSLRYSNVGHCCRMKREKNNLEYEVTRHKSNTESERRKVEKLERDVAIAAEKAEKAQRAVRWFLQHFFGQSTYFLCHM